MGNLMEIYSNLHCEIKHGIRPYINNGTNGNGNLRDTQPHLTVSQSRISPKIQYTVAVTDVNTLKKKTKKTVYAVFFLLLTHHN